MGAKHREQPMSRHQPFPLLVLTLFISLGVGACSDNGWKGQWKVVEVSTPLTGASRTPLEASMLGREVTLSAKRAVLPHYTEDTKTMVIPIERVESDTDSADVILHPSGTTRYVDSSLILTPQDNGTLILHGAPKDGPSANFFLTLRRP